MAIARVTSQDTSKNDSTTPTSSTISYPATPTAGNLLIAVAYENVAASNVSMTSSGWTILAQIDVTGISLSVWYKIAGAGESQNVTVAATGSTSARTQIVEYSGFSTGTPLDVNTSNTSNVTVTTLSSGTTATTTSANELWFAAFATSGTVTGPSFTNSFNLVIFGANRTFTAEKIVSATGTAETTATWTTATRAIGIIGTFKAGTAGSAGFTGWGLPI